MVPRSTPGAISLDAPPLGQSTTPGAISLDAPPLGQSTTPGAISLDAPPLDQSTVSQTNVPSNRSSLEAPQGAGLMATSGGTMAYFTTKAGVWELP
jgi:hypothetical protein